MQIGIIYNLHGLPIITGRLYHYMRNAMEADYETM